MIEISNSENNWSNFKLWNVTEKGDTITKTRSVNKVKLWKTTAVIACEYNNVKYAFKGDAT
jgi:hypothetical protein